MGILWLINSRDFRDFQKKRVIQDLRKKVFAKITYGKLIILLYSSLINALSFQEGREAVSKAIYVDSALFL